MQMQWRRHEVQVHADASCCSNRARHEESVLLSTDAIIPPMWTFFLWIVLVCGAGLCYPRRPRTAGSLFIMAGALAILLTLARSQAISLMVLPGIFWIGLGAWYLMKFRNPEIRAKHVHYWTAKA